MVLADCSKCQVYLPKDKRVIEGRVELFPNEVIRLYFSDYQLSDGRLKTAVRFSTAREVWWIWTASW